MALYNVYPNAIHGNNGRREKTCKYTTVMLWFWLWTLPGEIHSVLIFFCIFLGYIWQCGVGQLCYRYGQYKLLITHSRICSLLQLEISRIDQKIIFKMHKNSNTNRFILEFIFIKSAIGLNNIETLTNWSIFLVFALLHHQLSASMEFYRA